MAWSDVYRSPLGDLLLQGDAQGLTALHFQRKGEALPPPVQDGDAVGLAETRAWLDAYFARRPLPALPPLHLEGTTFQMEVWRLLLTLDDGALTTYGTLAAHLAAARGVAHMSAQAVGGAVGRNPVAIIVPCHRVIGAGGNLTGYAGGIDKKIALLALEGHDMKKFSLPKRK